ncbi:hydrogenase formation protein HypD [Marinobacter sp. SS8-8]|uniref:hydrogenase formation protein HypD n=1 Tax=Marinobacter sp. SS8-8 TaxID=3050452 RepID=UPI0026DEED39|nr:hydrogenase formation protein HypD [Marinobacter sp. SS8-8]|tara:strand:+ start:1458 stop:2564 length:1107 start_codon:yes stop_codon:yes gene_type:complete
MKYRDEYRTPDAARGYADAIARITTRPWTLMEVCGGQTHAIVRFGIDQLLPEAISLIHGPGCPVCVTPIAYIDKALEIAALPRVILCTFGDMLRVPGTQSDLSAAKARGADVRVVYSPLDALMVSRQNPKHEVVFFAVGFETTAPANAMAVYQAQREGLGNFSVLVSQVLVPPAIRALLERPGNRVQGFLAAGHVCTITGYEEYEPITREHGVPIVVTGFEPLDILEGVYRCVRQLEQGESCVENQYSRAVRRPGNAMARQVMQAVFQVVPRQWRGMGDIPDSGLGLSPAYRSYDAETRFGAVNGEAEMQGECLSGAVLRGEIRPDQCPAFGSRCTPERPLGVTMVSEEGACAAYYRYRRPAGDSARE